MLAIRYLKNVSYVKLIIFGIVIAFVAPVIVDSLSSRLSSKKSALVNFDSGDQITMHDLQLASKMWQEQNALHVLQALVEGKLTMDLARRLSLRADDDTLLGYIAKMPSYLDEQGEFDSKKFRSILLSLRISKEQYLSAVNDQLVQNAVMHSFSKFYLPQMLRQDMLASLMKEIDVAVYSANINDFSQGKQKPKTDEVKKFFEDNRANFVIPESRDISYLVLKNLDDDTREIVEDSIAYGSSLEDIAKQLAKPVSKLAKQSAEQISKNADLQFFKQKIFAHKAAGQILMEEDPKGGAVLFVISAMYPAREAEFQEVSAQVTNAFIRTKAQQKAIDALKSPSLSLLGKNSSKPSKKQKVLVKRYVIHSGNSSGVPGHVLHALNSTSAGEAVEPYVIKDQVFLVQIVGSRVNKKLFNKDFEHQVEKFMQVSLQEELLNYLFRSNPIQVNNHLLQAAQQKD